MPSFGADAKQSLHNAARKNYNVVIVASLPDMNQCRRIRYFNKVRDASRVINIQRYRVVVILQSGGYRELFIKSLTLIPM